jgi:hypothetical protein
MSSNAGLSNLYLVVEETSVRRGYAVKWLHEYLPADGEYEKMWHEMVEVLSQADLITEPACWVYKASDCIHPEHGSVVDVSNPKMELLTFDECMLKFGREGVYSAYEDLLRRLVALWKTHGVIISDAHSNNLCPCLVEGRLKYCILDGKLAGPMKSWQWKCAVGRLEIKVKCEKNECHQWLLRRYIQALSAW